MSKHPSPQNRAPLAPIEAADQFIKRKRRAIEGLLRMAVAVLPRVYDCGLFYDEKQTFRDPTWPFDVWIDRGEFSTAFVVRAGHWEGIIDFHNQEPQRSGRLVTRRRA